eukprot:3463618-Rhodomonas_salina.2
MSRNLRSGKMRLDRPGTTSTAYPPMRPLCPARAYGASALAAPRSRLSDGICGCETDDDVPRMSPHPGA